MIERKTVEKLWAENIKRIVFQRQIEQLMIPRQMNLYYKILIEIILHRNISKFSQGYRTSKRRIFLVFHIFISRCRLLPEECYRLTYMLLLYLPWKDHRYVVLHRALCGFNHDTSGCFSIIYIYLIYQKGAPMMPMFLIWGGRYASSTVTWYHPRTATSH